MLNNKCTFHTHEVEINTSHSQITCDATMQKIDRACIADTEVGRRSTCSDGFSAGVDGDWDETDAVCNWPVNAVLNMLPAAASAAAAMAMLSSCRDAME